ncbi:unnamed protein product [Periconia digitata]|uniref:Uncharacterized protein n=1 Tax=Periconia digitata TaxID=1303443 RepID=A0A9W4XLC2_9PLEO|nr:unnamed protein product [Periconia digitata]
MKLRNWCGASSLCGGWRIFPSCLAQCELRWARCPEMTAISHHFALICGRPDKCEDRKAWNDVTALFALLLDGKCMVRDGALPACLFSKSAPNLGSVHPYSAAGQYVDYSIDRNKRLHTLQYEIDNKKLIQLVWPLRGLSRDHRLAWFPILKPIAVAYQNIVARLSHLFPTFDESKSPRLLLYAL